MKVKNRKNHTIIIDTSAYTNNTISYSFRNINFIPDEMIVKNLSYINNDATREFGVIYTNLVNDYICSFSATQSNTFNCQLDLHFPLAKEISGAYTFTLLDSNKAISTMNAMVIGLTLEFVEYSKDEK
jgi:hypothetical protein